MPGLLPDAGNGGQIIRDAGGVCTNPPNVLNAYCPPASFTSSCELTALPQDCTSRIMPSQINGIVSELLCFAATISPTGNWNCASNCNLAAAFTAWAAANKLVDGVTIIGAGTLLDPWRVDPGAIVDAICADDIIAAELAACVLSGDANNSLVIGSDGKLYVPLGTQLADQITILGDGSVGNEFRGNIPEWISDDLGNEIELGSDGKLYVNDLACPAGVAACNDRVKVYTPGGACKIITHLPEPQQITQGLQGPLEVYNPGLVTPDTEIFGVISSFDVTNPDLCRPMLLRTWVGIFMRLETSFGPISSVRANLYTDFGGGFFVNNIIAETMALGHDGAVSPNCGIDMTKLRSQSTGNTLIPPGGTITIRVQTSIEVLTCWQTLWNAHTDPNDNVLSIRAQVFQTWGRSL